MFANSRRTNVKRSIKVLNAIAEKTVLPHQLFLMRFVIYFPNISTYNVMPDKHLQKSAVAIFIEYYKTLIV